MKIKNRFMRVGVVIASVGLLTTQISGSVALAQFDCPTGDGGGNSSGAIVAGGVGAAVLIGGLLGGGGAATAGAAGLAVAGSSTLFGLLSGGGLGAGYSVLNDLVSRAGLQDLLSGNGKTFTFFAPTDEAFAKLPAGVLDELKKDKEKLRKVLEAHIVDGAMTEAELTAMSEGSELTSRAGTKIKIGGIGGLSVNGRPVIQADIRANNGIIHTIDQVLVPNEG